MWFTAETSEVFEMKNFTQLKHTPPPDGLSLVIPFPHPQRVYERTAYAGVITKFSRMGR